MSGYRWLTPPGPAALSLLRVRDAPLSLIDREPPAPGRARFVRVLAADGAVIDEAVAWRSDDALELSLHGGSGVRAAIEVGLRGHGLSPEDRVEDAEWSSLARAASPAATRWLLSHGSSLPPFGAEFLTRAPVVLITGPANAGKSTLLNAWCGRERALVSELPGTTRDLLAAETIVGGWRLRLLDSAGLRASDDPLERAGQQLVDRARAFADLVVRLRPPGDEAPAVPGDLEVLGKADLRGALPVGAVAWSSVGIAGAPAAALLAALGRAVLVRLALPELV
jgi:hypothetical protein